MDLSPLQRFLARSPFWIRIVLKVRNQCQQVLRFFFDEGILPSRNGEGAVCSAIAPLVDTFMDVGANRGEWTLAFLRSARPTARGLLGEPSLSALAKLRRELPPGAPVEVLEAAFSDGPGEATFFEEPAGGETSSLVPGFSRADATPRKVRLVTIDGETDRLRWSRVGFIKVDAEGHDAAVLRGARRLLSEGRIDVIQFEYNAPWKTAGERLGDTIQFLEKAGYDVYLVKRAGLFRLHTPEWLDYFHYSNYLAVRRGFALPPSLRVHSLDLHFW